MEPKYEALLKLFKDESEAKKLLELAPEDAVVYLKEQHGLEFTVEELNDVAAGMKKALEDDSEELSEDALEAVSGGGKKSGAYKAGYYIGKGIKVVGTGVGIAAGLVALGVISW